MLQLSTGLLGIAEVIFDTSNELLFRDFLRQVSDLIHANLRIARQSFGRLCEPKAFEVGLAKLLLSLLNLSLLGEDFIAGRL